MAKTPFNADRGGAVLKFDPNDVIIIEDPIHPRYDDRIERPITDEYIASFEAEGQLEAGIVCSDEDGKPQVVNGRRRVRALRILNDRRRASGEPLLMFSATYRRVSSDAEAVALRFIANLHEPDPISARAKYAEDFVRRFGWPVAKVAPLFGVGPATIRQWLAALECAPPVLAALDGGRLGLAAAVKLAELPRKEQAEKLREMQGAKAPAEKAARMTGRTKSGRPTSGIIRRVASSEGLKEAHSLVRDVFLWADGKLSSAKLAENIPEIADALGIS